MLEQSSIRPVRAQWAAVLVRALHIDTTTHSLTHLISVLIHPDPVFLTAACPSNAWAPAGNGLACSLIPCLGLAYSGAAGACQCANGYGGTGKVHTHTQHTHTHTHTHTRTHTHLCYKPTHYNTRTLRIWWCSRLFFRHIDGLSGSDMLGSGTSPLSLSLGHIVVPFTRTYSSAHML